MGVRTGAEMYANDAMLDKVVSTTLAVTGIIGTILSFVPFPPVAAAGATMAIGSAIGMAAWKSFRGTYEGGAAGAAAGIASAGINYALDKASLGAVNVNLSYSYAGGFGVGVNVGEGLAAGVSYNEKSGFGVSAGVAGNGVSLMYTENFGKGDVRASHGWQAQLGGLEVSYDNLSGYSASFQAASTMFGDTNLKMTSSLTWSEQNGFNGSISYNFLTKEQMAKEAAKNAQKNTQQNQENLFLNIMDGLGYNLGGREGEPTLWDNIQGAFSGAWHQLTNPLETLGNIGNGFSKLGKGLAGLASGAWDGISGLFGGKKPEQVVMMPAMGMPMDEKDFINQVGKDRTLENIITGNIDPKSPQGMQMIMALEELGLLDQTVKATKGIPSDSTDQLPEDMKKQLLSTADRLTAKSQDGSITASELSLLKGIFNTFNKYGIDHPGMSMDSDSNIYVGGKPKSSKPYESSVTPMTDAGNAMQPGATVKDVLINMAERSGDGTKALSVYGKFFGAIGAAFSALNVYKIGDEIFTAGKATNSQVVDGIWNTAGFAMQLGLLGGLSFLTPLVLGHAAISVGLYFADQYYKEKTGKTTLQNWFDY
ncbi:hypothetical protein EHQ12_16465 [Leptospira gomenensis]|uniref:Uncharacterized protein n=1 Tax=Leptospira gomenensis TaxID=2484974 RepID=A0A5F1YG45_9LEPT|nr:hypothetical protein [Leptospira gomenensis]TGK34322.1 hypothetical protein EHQ12_16465 [Leptospira gomenensis]TGK37316.1 hypothetical protein EHQ17_03795 [Leptospira gomenensis]TGK51003.1 hypothetical protein EHQ07_03860 [Leptospira gomenensis]TGK56625.1 hypothetical protein EHQ13_15785 [Leptospira gomenensis]